MEFKHKDMSTTLRLIILTMRRGTQAVASLTSLYLPVRISLLPSRESEIDKSVQKESIIYEAADFCSNFTCT
jgi:hypothetical protein